jgi:RNA polymerase sigma-70 factor (ECF subfamily)
VSTIAASGLEASLRALMPDLLAYFVRRLDDREDAADALADTLVVLWRHDQRLPSDEESRRRYAFGVARRVLSTARRGRMRRHALADRLRDELHASASSEPMDPELDAALAGLKETDRELVLLVAWDGFGVAQAGELLGLKPEAARQRYSRARARLRDALSAAPRGRSPRAG